MLENAVARRYAQAFFAIAKGNNSIDKFELELKSIVDTINSNIELKKVINHQLVTPEEKKAIINAIFSEQISEITLNFINVIVDKYRATYIPAVYDEFVTYANQARNMTDAEVRTAAELSASDIENIKDNLAKVTGKIVRLKAKVDPDLIGGAVVRIGDKVIDGSLAGKLQKLKENLLQIEVKEIGVRN